LLVTVCGTCVIFFQITVVPAAIVSDAGLKVKLPLLSVVIETTTVGGAVGEGVGLGVGLGVGFGVGDGEGTTCVGVGVGMRGTLVGV
jgi:hypothetical protein